MLDWKKKNIKKSVVYTIDVYLVKCVIEYVVQKYKRKMNESEIWLMVELQN